MPDELCRTPDDALCVYCRRRPIEAAWQPFCSERCRLQDLARWIDGEYRIAGPRVSLPDHDEMDRSS